MAEFGQTCQKMAKIQFLGLCEKTTNKFSEIALKVSPKIVLQVRIVICPRKFFNGVKFEQKCEKVICEKTTLTNFLKLH